MELPELLTIVLGGLGLIGILSAAAAVARSSSIKQNLELLRGEVTDLTAANARLDAENTTFRAATLKQEERITFLEDLATSRSDVTQLIGEIRSANERLHADNLALLSLFYRNPDDARVAQEARRQEAERQRPSDLLK